MVFFPADLLFWASAIISISCFLPEETALSFMKADWVSEAMMLAMVVFPVPGGPQRIIDGTESLLMARRR